jgi:hypothetical protein
MCPEVRAPSLLKAGKGWKNAWASTWRALPVACLARSRDEQQGIRRERGRFTLGIPDAKPGQG